jgi:hypothetical protein
MERRSGGERDLHDFDPEPSDDPPQHSGLGVLQDGGLLLALVHVLRVDLPNGEHAAGVVSLGDQMDAQVLKFQSRGMLPQLALGEEPRGCGLVLGDGAGGERGGGEEIDDWLL